MLQYKTLISTIKVNDRDININTLPKKDTFILYEKISKNLKYIKVK